MRRVLFFLLFLCICSLPVQAQAEDDTLISRNIVYKTNKASEVYIYWATDYWKVPDTMYWPPNTVINEKYPCTKMFKQGDSFYVAISLPAATRVDYYFQLPKDPNGKSIDGWDTKLDNIYQTYFTDNKTLVHNDANLRIIKPAFSILHKGKYFLGASFLLFILAGVYFRNKLVFHKTRFLWAGIVAALFFMVLARLEISGTSGSIPMMVGALFPDLGYVLLVSIFFFFLLHLFRNRLVFHTTVSVLFFGLLFFTVLISLLNIEVVKQLGTPFSYKWLYYSDFLKGNDARAGAAKTLTPAFIKNILGLLASFVLLAYVLHLLFTTFDNPKWKSFVWIVVLVITGNSFYGFMKYPIKKANVQTPVFAFVASLYDPPGEKKLMDTKLSATTINYIEAYHKRSYKTPGIAGTTIDNIIVFVSESTPAQFVSVYDSTFACTPNLKRWQQMATVYQNMYAHIPSTPNSMLSLVSGIYPMIDYRSALLEDISIPEPSLPGILKNDGWATSLFFSSDLVYANMITYAKNQGFTFVQDYSTIPCDKKFSVTKTEMDGIDDSCMLASYLNWFDQDRQKKKFSVLWTNQTHSPYYTNDEVVYSKENDNLNRYLNALNHTDAIFDKLILGLENRGQLKNTLIIFTADHGEAFGTHEQKLHGTRVYQENVHVPCMLFNPVLFHGQNNNNVYGLVDIAPTITHMAGIPKPAHWQGNSLLDTSISDRTFFVSPYTDLIIGTRYKNLKYIYNIDTEEPELYDLEADPKEVKNIANKHPDLVKSEHELLVGWFQFVHNKYGQWRRTEK